jgi:hypothetical protein
MDFADFSRFGLRGACAHNVQRARDRTQQLFGEPVIMSIASLAAECARDAEAPGKASTSSPSSDSAMTNIVRFVPTEIVAVYVTLTTTLGTTFAAHGSSLEKERPYFYAAWLLVATILTPTFFAFNFIAEYRRIHNGKCPSLRMFPFLRIILSIAAFLVWALAVAPDATKDIWSLTHWPISTHLNGIATSLLLIVSPFLMSVDRAFSSVANLDTATTSSEAASSTGSESVNTITPIADPSVQESANPRILVAV